MVHPNPDRKTPGIKRPYLKLPESNEGKQSYCITIPGGFGNKKALLDLLQIPTYWFSWELSGGTEGKQTADAWRDLLNLPELKMCCCPEPTNRRYNAAGQLEVSYDNGDTWAVDNSLDDRFSGIIAPPMAGEDGEEKRCIAATAGQEFVKANLIDSLTEGQTYAEISAASVALIAVLGVTGIGLLIAAAAAAIFLAGVTAVQAAFTSEVWTDFRCILYCHMNDDGSFTEGQWQTVKGHILDAFSGVVSAVLYNWVNSVGPVGLTNAVRSGFAAAGDCDDCDCNTWCYTFEFSEGAQGWASYGQCAGAVSAIMAEGWQGECNTCGYFETSVERTFTGTVTSMEFRGWLEIDTGLPDAGIIVNDEQVYSHTAPQGESIHHIDGYWTGSLHVQMFANVQCSSFTQIRAITLRGTGSNPFGSDNCDLEE